MILTDEERLRRGRMPAEITLRNLTHYKHTSNMSVQVLTCPKTVTRAAAFLVNWHLLHSHLQVRRDGAEGLRGESWKPWVSLSMLEQC